MSQAVSATRQRQEPAWRRFLRRPVGVAAAIWLIGIIVATIAAPILPIDSPLNEDLVVSLQRPSAAHLLGTDIFGRDVLSRVLFGGRPALLGVAEALIPWLILGVTLGVVGGYLGGWVGATISRLADLLFSLPSFVVLLVVFAIFPDNLAAAMVALGVIGSAWLIRVVRARTLEVKEELYVSAALVSGLSHMKVMVRHVLPRITSTVIVQASIFAALALVLETGLAYLGFGVRVPAPSWGGLVADAAQVITQDAWLLVPGGGVIALTILAFALFGNAVRDVTAESWNPAGRRRKPPRSSMTRQRDEVIPATIDPDVLLAVEHLSVEFEDRDGWVPVISDVSFNVRRGETLALLGETGSGKSVTVAAVLGILPTNGRLVGGHSIFDGDDLTILSARQLGRIRGKRIGFIAQEPLTSLDPTFKVGSQIREAVRRHSGVSRKIASKRVIELLESVNLSEPKEIARRYPHQLSGGMAQRVVIALALAGSPDLLIADEPTTALDVTIQAEILALLHRLQEERGLSILLVTHDWGVVATMARRAVVMYAGQIVEEAQVTELFTRPLHPYTRGLLMANPQLTEPGERLPAMAGSAVNPGEWPEGCRFQTRCALATVECGTAPIQLTSKDNGRQVRCIHAMETSLERTG